MYKINFERVEISTGKRFGYYHHVSQHCTSLDSRSYAEQLFKDTLKSALH
jgi:hypothetical protein